MMMMEVDDLTEEEICVVCLMQAWREYEEM